MTSDDSHRPSEPSGSLSSCIPLRCEAVEPQQAHCKVWCPKCRLDFVVVGSARPHRGVTPAVELLKCPYCAEPRKVMLARHMQGPVTAAYRMDEWRQMSNQ